MHLALRSPLGIVVVWLLLASSVKAQDGPKEDWLPLEIGNVWIYGGATANTSHVVKDTVRLNDTLYFVVDFPVLPEIRCG